MKYIMLDPWNSPVSDLLSVFVCVYIDLGCVAVQLRMVCRKQVQLTTASRSRSRGGREGGVPVCCVSVCTLWHPLWPSPQSPCDTAYRGHCSVCWALERVTRTELQSKKQHGSYKWCWNRWDAALCPPSHPTGSGRTHLLNTSNIFSCSLQLDDLVEKAKDYALMHGW